MPQCRERIIRRGGHGEAENFSSKIHLVADGEVEFKKHDLEISH
jgi:hypothetical protein